MKIHQLCTQTTKMTAQNCELSALVFFTTQCWGVKFYSFPDGGMEFGDKLIFMRKPNHFKDPNCIEVRVIRDISGRRTLIKLGHVAAEAAEWLSPLFLGPFCITG